LAADRIWRILATAIDSTVQLPPHSPLAYCTSFASELLAMNDTYNVLATFQLPPSPTTSAISQNNRRKEKSGSKAMSNSDVPRERRPSTGAPISDIKGPVGPPGVTRPKHKRTFTGFGAGEIKSAEGMYDGSSSCCSPNPDPNSKSKSIFYIP
jgi:hypothetical protein